MVKPEKIKRTTLVKPIEQGGLNLTDIHAFIHSNKASWVKRLTDTNNKGQWKIFYQKELNKYGGDLVFECPLEEKHIITNFKNEFLRDILLSWNKVKSYDKSGHINKTILWNNSTIEQNNQNTFFYSNWFNRGIKFLEHIFDFRSKTFYNFDTFQNLYDIPTNDYLKYYTLIKSIPNSYKQKLIVEDFFNFNHDTLLKRVQSTKKVSKYLYNLQQTFDENKTKQQQTWESIMTSYNYTIDWKNTYQIPFKATIDNNLRNFQYKILQRTLPTNSYLYKCKLTPSNLCSFCASYKESLIHILYECNIVQPIWRDLEHYLASKDIYIDLNVLDIVFGTQKGGANSMVINYILILMKSYIYSVKNT